MSRHSDRIGDRIAEEAQLLAEEKWIIESLTKIKKQRNCLQIEKLQLESLEAKLKQKLEKKTSAKLDSPQVKSSSLTCTITSTTNTNRTVTAGSSRNNIEFETPLVIDMQPPKPVDFDACNDEELDLAVSKSVFSQELRDNIMEEYEEDDDDDMVIDMNMFMNSKNSSGKMTSQ